MIKPWQIQPLTLKVASQLKMASCSDQEYFLVPALHFGVSEFASKQPFTSHYPVSSSELPVFHWFMSRGELVPLTTMGWHLTGNSSASEPSLQSFPKFLKGLQIIHSLLAPLLHSFIHSPFQFSACTVTPNCNVLMFKLYSTWQLLVAMTAIKFLKFLTIVAYVS